MRRPPSFSPHLRHRYHVPVKEDGTVEIREEEGERERHTHTQRQTDGDREGGGGERDRRQRKKEEREREKVGAVWCVLAPKALP